MVDPINLRVNGSSTWLKDASTQMITISNTGNTATTKVLYSGYTGSWAAFQIPVGYKFIALVIQIQMASTATPTGAGDIALSDGAAGVAGTRFWEFEGGLASTDIDGNMFQSCDVYLDTWAAGEHVNCDFDSTTNWGISITGILTTV